MTVPQAPGGPRDRRILKLLWWTLPLVLVLVLGGSGLIGLHLWSATSARAAESSDWAQAEVAYREQMAATQTFPQPWLSQYNLGTALLGTGSVEEGVELLNSALDGVPKAQVQEDGTIGAFSYECSVRFNLSAGIEMQGDDLAAAGSDSEALEAYELALSTVAPCQIAGSGGSGSESGEGDSGSQGGSDSEGDSESQGDSDSEEQDGEQGQQEDSSSGDQQTEGSEQAGESADRLNRKIEELTGGTSEDQEADANSEGNSGSQQDGETAEEQERREKLEEKNREQAERQREDRESYNRNPGTGGW